jgi:hypothetical protein
MAQQVKFNVGGIQYTTTVSTIAQYPDSMLAVMIEQENERRQIEKGEELFIDRNGPIFKYVLEFLRNGNRLILPDDKKMQRELVLEAEFYQLDGLKRLADDVRTKYSVGDILSVRYLTEESLVRKKIVQDFNRFVVLGSVYGTVIDLSARGDLVVEFIAKIGPNDSAQLSSIDKYRDVSLKYVIPIEDLLAKVIVGGESERF